MKLGVAAALGVRNGNRFFRKWFVGGADRSGLTGRPGSPLRGFPESWFGFFSGFWATSFLPCWLILLGNLCRGWPSERTHSLQSESRMCRKIRHQPPPPQCRLLTTGAGTTFFMRRRKICEVVVHSISFPSLVTARPTSADKPGQSARRHPDRSRASNRAASATDCFRTNGSFSGSSDSVATVVVSRLPVTMPCSAKSKTSSEVGVRPRSNGRSPRCRLVLAASANSTARAVVSQFQDLKILRGRSGGIRFIQLTRCNKRGVANLFGIKPTRTVSPEQPITRINRRIRRPEPPPSASDESR